MGSAALYDCLRASDEAVAKALGLSEVARIARAERRLREYLLVTWKRHARDAVKIAARRAEQGKTARQVAAAVRDRMRRWPKEVLPRVKKEVERVYRLARIAGWKKATGQTKASLSYDTPNMTEILKAKPKAGFKALPSFGLVDENAVEALQRHQVFWIGEHYDANLGATIAETSSEAMVEAGADRVAAGKLIQERLSDQMLKVATPLGFHGSAVSYFEGLAANAVTTARAVAQTTSFMHAGITRYEVSNPRDRRTCQVCVHMDGKTFSVEQGADTISGVLAAEAPEDVKKAQPWHGESKASIEELHRISPKAGDVSRADSEALSKAGFNVPPFHFRCLLEGQQVAGVFLGASRATYSGPAVELSTRGGRKVSLTPGHPVMTSDGLAAVGLLGAGARVACSTQMPRPVPVDEAFRALEGDFGSTRVVVPYCDFHGDARHLRGFAEITGIYQEGEFSAEEPPGIPKGATFEEVLRVRRFDFSGYVFDFQTSSGLIVVDGIQIGNCRCAVDIDVEAPYAEPVTPPWA